MMMITLYLAQRAGWRNAGARGTSCVRNYCALLDSVDLYQYDGFDDNTKHFLRESFLIQSTLFFQSSLFALLSACLMLLPYALVHLPVLDGQ